MVEITKLHAPFVLAHSYHWYFWVIRSIAIALKRAIIGETTLWNRLGVARGFYGEPCAHVLHVLYFLSIELSVSTGEYVEFRFTNAPPKIA